MNCTNHTDVEATGMCAYCGKPFCSDCLIEVKGRMYCKDDLDKVFDETKSSATPQINITNTSANVNTNQNNVGGVIMPGQKSRVVALLLCLFLGYLGIHRFYVGKVGTGILWFFTAGIFGIGWLIDFLMILFGGFKDNWGRPLI
ncbi:MAG: NINE protein [Oscillospiraceae bacterium]|nr:NINE protein [Oscillospiraceae bacterium]